MGHPSPPAPPTPFLSHSKSSFCSNAVQGIGAHYSFSRKKIVLIIHRGILCYFRCYFKAQRVLEPMKPDHCFNLLFVSQESAVNAGCLNFHWNWAGCDEMCSFMFCCKLKISHQSDHKDIKPLERLRGISNSTWRTPTTTATNTMAAEKTWQLANRKVFTYTIPGIKLPLKYRLQNNCDKNYQAYCPWEKTSRKYCVMQLINGDFSQSSLS